MPSLTIIFDPGEGYLLEYVKCRAEERNISPQAYIKGLIDKDSDNWDREDGDEE